MPRQLDARFACNKLTISAIEEVALRLAADDGLAAVGFSLRLAPAGVPCIRRSDGWLEPDIDEGAGVV
jgi:hypothetical protein